MKTNTQKQGINAALARADSGAVFWVENGGHALTGYMRTGAEITQEGFWAVSKRTGETVPLLRVVVTKAGKKIAP